MSHLRSGTSAFFVVFVALLLLLTLTVEVARHDLGRWNFVAAMAIASSKALLIILYFMHVRHSVQLTKLVVCAGFVWLAILFTFSLADYWTRGWGSAERGARSAERMRSRGKSFNPEPSATATADH